MLYIFLGADSFSRRETLRNLKADLDQDGMLASNTSVIDARQVSVEEIVATCQAHPFFGKHRLVIVEGLLQSAGRPRRRPGRRERETDDAASSELHPLVQSITEMPETTILVLVDDKASDRELLEALRRKGKLERFDPPNQKAVPTWIQRRAQALGLRIEARAASLLADAVGADTWMLASEIDKLHAYAGERVVREGDVRALVSRVRELQGYLLSDAVADLRPDQALKLLHELIDQNSAPQALLSTIEGRFRRIAVTREMLDAGASGSEIGRQIGAKDYGLERYLEQAGRWSPDQLREAITRIAQADADTKGGVYEEELSLELLVCDLAGVAVSRAA